jgi:hypothetical protein
MFGRLVSLNLLWLASCHPAYASGSPCDYDHQSSETYQLQIEATDDIQSKSYDIAEGARKCVVDMKIMVENVWHPSDGTYVYGPDIPETTACERAELKAKENLIKLLSPVIINSEKNLNCQLTNKPIVSKIDKVSNCKEWKTIWIDGVEKRGWRNICD